MSQIKTEAHIMPPTSSPCTLTQSTKTYSHCPPIMTSKVLPVPIPNASQEYQGWRIDNLGIFYVYQLNHRSALSCCLCWGQFDFVKEIMSNSPNQSLWGSCTKSKFNAPYTSHYYFGIFNMYTILKKALSPLPAGLNDAICSHPQFDDTPGVHNYPPEFESFPTGFRCWLQCFIQLMPSPIPSPLPLPSLSHPQHGWAVNLTGDVFLNELDQSKWTEEMWKAIGMSYCRGVVKCIHVPHWTY